MTTDAAKTPDQTGSDTGTQTTDTGQSPPPSSSTTTSQTATTDSGAQTGAGDLDTGKAWDVLRAALPDDVKSIIKNNGHEGHSLAEILASYGANLRFNGADKAHLLPVPKKSREEDPEGWKAFDEGVAKHLGRPESAEAYGEYTPPEGMERQVDDSTLALFDKTVHERGGLLATAQGRKEALDVFHQINKQASEAMEAEYRAQIDEGLKALKGEWGGAYEEKLKAADRVIDQLLPEAPARELRSFLESSGVKDEPAVIRALYAMAEKLSGDGLPQGGSRSGDRFTPSVEEAKARIAQIEADPVYQTGDQHARKALSDERMRLYKIAYGGA